MALQENIETQDAPKVWSKVKNTKWAQILVCICLLMCLISSTGASLLQTGFGAVEVTRFNLPTQGGSWIAGRLYRPANSSSTNKVPLVVTMHGYLNDNNMQDITAIELSRRGIAVMAIDWYAHGDSSFTSKAPTGVQVAAGSVPVIEFAWNLDWVNRERIGIMGHSMGGMNAFTALAYYGQLYRTAYAAAIAATSEGGTTITAAEQATITAADKIWAGFPTSWNAGSTAQWAQIHANVGVSNGYFGEMGEGKTKGGTDAASLVMINSGLPANAKITSVVIGRFYGDATTKTLRVMYVPREIHPWQHFSTDTAADTVTFFTTAFIMNNPIPATSQVWLWKEMFNFLGLIACFLFIIPFGVLLVKAPVFASMARPVPQQLPALSSIGSRLFFWGMWMLAWVISFRSYVPVAVSGAHNWNWPGRIIKTTMLRQWFPQSVTNYFLMWAIFNGVVALVLFFLAYRFIGKRNGVTTAMMGFKISFKNFLKCILMAATICLGFYLLVLASEYFFGVDYRIWTFDITLFRSTFFLTTMRYFPFFFIFFAANSLAINGSMRVAGQKEWFNILAIAIGNSLGVIILLVAQYWSIITTFTAKWSWLTILVAVPLIPLLFISAYISRYLFKATGNIWVGALVNTFIVVSMGVGNTQTPTPF